MVQGPHLFRYHSFPFVSAETDGIYYMLQATDPVLRADPFHGPGYSTAIRIGHTLGLDPFAAAKAVSVLSGIIFVVATWFIVSSLASAPEALLTTLIVAFSPVTTTLSVTIMSDMMAASAFLAALALLLYPRAPRPWHFLLGGICAGVAYLTRYVYLFIPVVPLLYWPLISTRTAFVSTCLRGPAIFLVGFLLTISPWLVFLYKTQGSPFWSHNDLNILFKLRGSGNWHTFPSVAEHQGLLSIVLADPALFIRAWIKTLVQIPWSLLDLVPRVGILASAGFAFWFARIDEKKCLFFPC